MVDDDGVGPSLGLGALAGVVDDERVDERHVAERDVGEAAGRQPDALARQPLERAVLADVDDGVGAPPLVEPAVEREVVVGRRQVGRVVDGDGLSPKPRGGWMATQHPAEVEPGEDQVAAAGST